MSLDIAVSISGDLDLTLSDANGYEVVSVGPGSRTWIKQTASSLFTNSRVVTSQKLDVGTIPLVVRCKASSHSVLAARVVALINAVEQTSFTLTAVIEGVTWSWACETANTVVGDTSGALDPHGLRSVRQLVTASIPRDPVALSGPV